MDQQKRPINWRLWVAVALGTIVFIVALQNSQEVDVDVLMVNLTAPLIVVILAAAAIGGVLGYIAPLVRRHHREDREGR